MEGLKKYFYKEEQKILSQPKIQIGYFYHQKLTCLRTIKFVHCLDN